jgi:uncharacterized protein YbjQ (UPF0145 family)
LSFVFVPWRRGAGRGRRFVGNFELDNYTKSLYAAREQAMERLQSTALALGAQGVVGTDISEGQVSFAHHALKFVATGTAVALVADAHVTRELVAVVSLDDLERDFEAESLRGS